MSTKAIKISEDNYNWLVGIAGDLQKIEGKSVSIDKAISYIKEGEKIRSSDVLKKVAGSWKISDSEAKELRKNLNKGWKRWKIKSV